MNTFGFPACIRAAAAYTGLPACFRTSHELANLALTYALGYQTPCFTKLRAAMDRIEANLELDQAHGHGNRAAKRAAQIETAQWFAEREADQNCEEFEQAYAAEHGIDYHNL